MKKILISVDLEGVAGVSSLSALMPNGWEWNAARKWMTLEAKAVAEAALESGFSEAIISDSHGVGLNIDPELLPHGVQLTRGWPRPFVQMEGIDQPDVTACAFIGYHSAAGKEGLLAHSFSGSAFRSIHLNGELASEGYFNAALAGSYDKPVLLISGDQHAVEDSQRYAPDAATFVTKQAIGWSSQTSLPPSQICSQLREFAADAFRATKPIHPFKIEPPYEVTLEMVSQIAAETFSFLDNVERRSSHTVAATFDSMASAMRFIAFASFYNPQGTIPN